MASLYVPSRVGYPISPGAKLFFYETGTTTPQNTYSQSDLAIGHVNTNPVVADANGLFGPIYLLASPDYKTVFQLADASLSITTDPILTAAVSVITTEGDLIVGDNTGNASRLAIGSAGQYLRSDGTDPSWHALLAADLSGPIPKANATPGSVIQSVLATTNSYTSHTTAIPYDDTIPQNTEGEQILTATITPTSTSTKVRCTAILQVDGAAQESVGAIFRGAGVNALYAASSYANLDALNQLILAYEDVPGSVAAQVYNIRVGTNGGGALYVNGTSGGRMFGGTCVSSLLLEEIAV